MTVSGVRGEDGPASLVDVVATLGEVLEQQHQSMRRLHDTVRALVETRGPDSVSRQLYDDVRKEMQRHIDTQQRRAERAEARLAASEPTS